MVIISSLIFSLPRPHFAAQNIEEYPWERADLNVHLMKYVSVGPGGIFASQAKDESVWCRFNMQNGKATTKVPMDGKGDGWNKIANVSLAICIKNAQQKVTWGSVSLEICPLVRILRKSPAGCLRTRLNKLEFYAKCVREDRFRKILSPPALSEKMKNYV